MGFCTEEQVQRFFRQSPDFERMLIDDGTTLVKYWFSVSDQEQERRFLARANDPYKQWKLTSMDIESRKRWVDYSKAKDDMFAHCDTLESPWWEVEADDKLRARVNCIAHLVSQVPYRERPRTKLKLGSRPAQGDYQRPPREGLRFVPDHAAQVLG
jgi:polyphosphate kinase 2 (PPK2 family)